MASILLLLAHPLLERSRVHCRLLDAARRVPGVHVQDLYERYPDFDVDVKAEQKLLLRHDIIIWQFPMYWYSIPPLLKQWQDLVLEHGWAYGRQGTALDGKRLFVSVSTGGGETAYAPGGFNKHDLASYLLPLERTVELCRMRWLQPFWVPGVHRMDEPSLDQYALQYGKLLTSLTNDHIPELLHTN